jgi:ATP-dependent helicase HrpA
MSKDKFRFISRIRKFPSLTADKKSDFLTKLQRDIQKSTQIFASRKAQVPDIDFPSLPVSERKVEIAEAISNNQVVIIAGETGSGKTTQIPKICLELGRGIGGLIGHTQPRRLAARTVANRIAEELKSPLGQQVGFKIRFSDQVSDNTYIKLMTDGILLAEIQQDKFLSQYDTIIIDEAHERSLNIDFILGYLKQLLPRRPELKLIITSATIDPLRFSKHFNDAPVIEISGRTYPVQMRYREMQSSDYDQTQAIIEAVNELLSETRGDILVFLSGEREIRDTADALNKQQYRHTEVLPLYARLSNSEQNKVFSVHSARRIVLATNVAETSLTVPGIKYVIDPGTARISRYSVRSKVQRLPIEPISQASANQRAGRCGRVSDGICIRLYSEDDYLSRDVFTDPEILRTNLASVILQMMALGLGKVDDFPFVQPPDSRSINDGFKLLEELGAIDNKLGRQGLTHQGRQLARLPIDPRYARMVIEANKQNCLSEVLIIAAGLSIQDPKERPQDKKQQADQMHEDFTSIESDFLGFFQLWQGFKQQQQALSSSQLRHWCKKHLLTLCVCVNGKILLANLKSPLQS